MALSVDFEDSPVAIHHVPKDVNCYGRLGLAITTIASLLSGILRTMELLIKFEKNGLAEAVKVR